MDHERHILVVSDIHYASRTEQQRGRAYELQGVTNPLQRHLIKAYRHWIWLRNPFGHNHMLDKFLDRADQPDWVVANGDFSCDTAFVGVSDEAAFQSAADCLSKLRQRFGEKFQPTFGDHELGKLNLPGTQGGLRLASWQKAVHELRLPPFWTIEIGCYLLIGVTSSVIALPVLEKEALPEEREHWRQLRAEHMEEIRRTFEQLHPDQRVLLFCHDPTALPYLAHEQAVQTRLDQVELTVIGHLHSPFIFWKSRLLAGMPPIHFLGNSIRRMSHGLNQARHWRRFNVQLCPSLSGIQLLKDGGYCSIALNPDGKKPARFRFHPLSWET